MDFIIIMIGGKYAAENSHSDLDLIIVWFLDFGSNWLQFTAKQEENKSSDTLDSKQLEQNQNNQCCIIINKTEKVQQMNKHN